jgi:hypothetical protein
MRTHILGSIPTMMLALSLITIASATLLPQLALAPRIHNDSVQSTNWSGFAVIGTGVSDAKGSWIVPAIQGTCPSTNQYSSFWVGIDGYSSGTVEQTGTDSDCQSGTPTYYAWYEFYPHPLFIINSITVHPGDTISADASFNGKSFVTTITDQTSHQTFSTSAKVRSAQRTSAEWIAEAPSSSGGVLPLANFGTAKFGTENTGVTGTNYATINGVPGTIGSFGSNVHQITMVTNGGVVKASPSSLSTDGTSFTVTWKSAGP